MARRVSRHRWASQPPAQRRPRRIDLGAEGLRRRRPDRPRRARKQDLHGRGGTIVGGTEIGKIVAIDAKRGAVTDIAGPAPLVVDVERGRGQTMFGLAQGTHSAGDPGSPADPNTGELLRVDNNGGFSIVANELDRPTSLEIIGTTAYVVTLGGDIWKIDNISGPPYGH